MPSIIPSLTPVEYFMCGDIGGTNSRMQLFKISDSDLRAPEVRGCGKPPGTLVHERKYLNQDFPSGFDLVCLAFLKECKERDPAIEKRGVGSACFAVAGPVDCNKVAFTNRSAWVVDGEALKETLCIPAIRLINDFVANGYGLLALDTKNKDDIHTIVDVPAKPGAPIACVGAGTGLGMTYCTCPEGGTAYDAFASEGGHTEFSPRTILEIELLEHLKEEFGESARVSSERIVSGKGMVNVYTFLKTKWPEEIRQDVEDEMKELGDNAGFAIAKYGQAEKGTPEYCPLCGTTMEIFWSAYGCEVGSSGLKWLPFGGLYIAGGIAQKNLERFTYERKSTKSPGLVWGFMPAYRDKGRVSKVLDGVPLHVVMADDVGQRGAQLVALRELRTAKGISSVAVDKDKSNHEFWGSLAMHAIYAAAFVGLAAVMKSKK